MALYVAGDDRPMYCSSDFLQIAQGVPDQPTIAPPPYTPFECTQHVQAPFVPVSLLMPLAALILMAVSLHVAAMRS